MPNCIIVFAKQPVAGASKTRIGEVLGHDVAQRLAQAFLLDTLELARANGAELVVAYAPEAARGWFVDQAPGVSLLLQPDLDFGARVAAAFEIAFERGATRVVVLGMDTPHLEAHRLDEAFRALESAEVCIGPAEDGGYYLIGLRRPAPHLFGDVPWSTSRVLQVTLERALEARLDVAQLALEFDVDEAHDVERLRSVLGARPGVGARTREQLDALRQ